jgi:mannosyltransferase
MSRAGQIAPRRQRDPPRLFRPGLQPAGDVTGPLGPGSVAGPALVALVLAVCIALRFLTRSDLWLDEALTVNIARLPLRSLFDALRHDGSPPLYYLLLHGWMRWLGTGDLAVRALSGIFSILTLPVAWAVGRRVGGEVAGWSLVLLLASSPFALRFATETRMYSLVTLLSLLAYLALTEAVRRPSVGRLLLLAGTTGLLLLTHYWAFYLVGGMLGVTALRARHARRAAMRTAAALVCGAIPLLPWLPSFLFQLRHTGTPWGSPPNATVLLGAIQAWTHPRTRPGLFLFWTLVLLVVVGVFDRHAGEGAREPPWPHGRDLCLIVVGTFALATIIGQRFGISYAPRYTSIVLPLFLLLAALGVKSFSGPVRWVVVALAVTCGIAVSTANVTWKRTQAGEVAPVLRAGVWKSDVVLYCPDQLGPGVSRLVPKSVRQVTFPDFGPPELVDWVDYIRRNRARDPAVFARALDRRAGAGRIWVVYSDKYPVAGAQCARVTKDLGALRPVQTVVQRPDRSAYEHGWLLLYEPPAG